MKICKKCGYQNPNSVNVCEKCYGFLDGQISEETTEEFFEKLERKEKIINIINYSLLIVYFIIVVPLFVLSVKAMESFGAGIIFFFLLLVGFPGMFYAAIFHPDTLFEITYMKAISNISDAQPSDWYNVTTKWGAYLLLGFGIFIIAKIYSAAMI